MIWDSQWYKNMLVSLYFEKNALPNIFCRQTFNLGPLEKFQLKFYKQRGLIP